MLPENTGRSAARYRPYPNKTYAISIKNGCIAGYCDGQQALAQAIYKILATIKYSCIIYGDSYGTRLIDYLGQLGPQSYGPMEREITAALLADGRFTGVDSFSFNPKGNVLYLSFRVSTATYSFIYEGQVNLFV